MQQADYHARLEQAVLLLEGKHQSLCQELQEKMEAAAEELRFERAAEYRDRLRAIELLGEKQLVTASAGTRRRRKPASRCCTLSRAI